MKRPIEDSTFPPPAEAVLQVRNLNIFAQSGAHRIPLVQDVSLELARGEVLGLIGESGAGKSTLGLATMGYARTGCGFECGEVIFAGQDLLKLSAGRREQLRGNRITYVAQSAAASFNPAFRLIDQIIETPTRVQGESRSAAATRARQLFREMRLPDPDRIGERYPHQVSGGQLQRMMIAMALMSKPDLIIFDEPTTALDVSTQRDVLITIREAIRSHGTAAIYISHDLAVVAQVADRITIMRHGKVIETGTTREVMHAPKEDYTRLLWSVRKLQMPERAKAEPVFSLTDLAVSYGQKQVLADVDLEIGRGTILAVVGESGSGKTTLGRAIAGLLPQATGQAILDGKPLGLNLAARSAQEARRIQYIYQHADTALNPRQSIAKIIMRPMMFWHGLSRSAAQQRAAELMDMVALPRASLGKLPSELSGGQRQRVSIARAIAAKPDLLVCDEITSALDQVVQGEILSLLRQLQQQTGLTCLFITHDIDTVRAIADQVVVMNLGKIVEAGSRHAVLNTPQDPYTRDLLAAVPQMDPDWLTRQIGAA